MAISQQADSLRLYGEALIAKQVEHLAALEENGLDISELTSGLEQYLDHPLNLNAATKDELKRLLFIDEVQIKNLLDYRNKYGEFLSVYELNAIEGIGRNTIEKIMPFVRTKPAGDVNSTRKLFDGKHEAILRCQRKLAEQAGYREPQRVYPGDPARLYFRYRYKVRGKLSLGMITEKDPGEKYFNKDYGPDFLSFHIAYESKSILKRIIAGDFHARFGQGLVLWTGLSYSGGSDPSSIKRYAPGISPNTSSNENSYFRGGAATMGYKALRLTLFYSTNKTDANIESDHSGLSEPYVSSFPNSGYHRTSGERADRNSLLSQHLGGNIKYLGNRSQLGVTVLYNRFQLNVITGSQAEDMFRFHGQNNLVWGMDYNVLLRRTNIFGELAMSLNKGWALLSGICHTTDNGAILCFQIREYRKNYQNLFAQANGRRDHNANERGIRVLMEFPLLKKWTVSASWDHYEFPWLTHGNISPVRGMDVRTGILYNGYSSANISASYRYRSNTRSSGLNNGWTDSQDWQLKQELKLKARLQLSQSFSTQVQAGYILTQRAEEGFRSAGACLATDVHYHPPEIPLKIVGRYAVFNTDDYDSRLYFYENDVLYASSMPAYYGKGFRCYFLMKYSPVSWLDTWLRFSMTVYADRTTISSGNDEIQGNKLLELKMQLRVKL